MVLRMRLIMIQLLMIRGMGEDLEKLGFEKIIIWVALRGGLYRSKERMTPRHILSGRTMWSWFLIVTIILKIRR